jgi:outer membrane receptor protein involved in Fe transport
MAGFDATLSGNVNNLLNYQYILKAWNPNTVASTSTPKATADNIYCFFDSGRTMTVRLKLNF